MKDADRDSEEPELSPRFRKLCEEYQRQMPTVPEPNMDLIIGYIDDVLPTAQMREDIRALIENDPDWRLAYREFKDAIEARDSGA